MDIDGVECRRWEGYTPNGVRCDVYVRRLRVLDDGANTQEFEEELLEAKPSEIRRRSNRRK
jgi:hypothetical protein